MPFIIANRGPTGSTPANSHHSDKATNVKLLHEIEGWVGSCQVTKVEDADLGKSKIQSDSSTQGLIQHTHTPGEIGALKIEIVLHAEDGSVSNRGLIDELEQQ